MLIARAGGGASSTPTDDIGPYTAVELTYPGEPTRHFVPVQEVIDYIDDHTE
jgi:hypothetical protein